MEKQLDPIEFEVVSGALTSIAEEMSASLGRSSYSPIIREMLDYSCAIFDNMGVMIAQAENIPVQLSFLGYGIRSLIRQRGASWFKNGDVVGLNHPYRGGNHTPDIQLFKPMFHEDRLVAFLGNTAHHIDVGGTEPGTEGFDNSEIFQEGLLLSGIKLFSEDRANEDVFTIIQENVRNPSRTMGDIRAQIAANNLGELRLLELLRKLGLEKLEFFMNELQDYSERRVNSELEMIADGTAYCEGFMDDDGLNPKRPIKIAAKVSKSGHSLEVDFTGSARQTNTGINLPVSNAFSAAFYALRCLLRDQTIPQNDGCYRNVTVIAPEGTIVNPRYPAAVSARHVTAQRQVDTVLRALSKIAPERLCAGCCLSFPTFNSETTDYATSAINVQTDLLGGGYGGNKMADGMDGVDVHMSNCALLPIEICESESSLKIVKSELVRDSGGPGKFRGGLAIARTYRVLADEGYVNAYSDQGQPEFAPWPLKGGLPGSPAKTMVTKIQNGKLRTRAIFPLKAHLRLGKNEEFTLISSGGGGYGNPLERDPQLVLEDVLNQKVSVGMAKLSYGVKIDKRRKSVDIRATVKERQRRKSTKK